MESVSRVYGYIDSTRDLTLEAAHAAANLRKPVPTSSGPSASSIPTIQLKKLLESKHEQEILAGLQRVVALTRRHPPDDLSHLLPTVLKNISSPNKHIRKLVYILLLYNAESDQDTALLAINSIQKALSASDAHLRALALRTISSLRVPVIAQIVSLGIKRGAGDMSPIVRRTAALAIPKCWRLDPSLAPQLETFLEQLLGDRQYFVAGAAVMAFAECCPDRDDMIHPHYRTLVRMLIDMDEWGQLATLRVLTRYSRRCFPRMTKRVKRSSANGANDDFYGDSTDEQDFETVDAFDPDLEYLLKTAQSLLFSRSSAVIVAVAAMYVALTTPTQPSAPASTYILAAVGPLMALLRCAPAIATIALHSIVQLAQQFPATFVPHARRLLLRASDPPRAAALKLDALAALFPHAQPHVQSLVLAELAHAARSRDATLVRAAVAALGHCAHTSSASSTASQRCLRLLLAQASSSASAAGGGPALATSEALTQIRHIVQSDPTAHVATVIRLAKDLDTATQPAARASIIWLVGEFAGVDAEGGKGSVAADVLRILAKGFADEDVDVKQQILVLAAKVYLHYLNSKPQQEEESAASKDGTDAETSRIPALYAYIHHLVRYDPSYPLRDLARTHRALLPAPSISTAPTDVSTAGAPASALTTQLATLLLNAPKPAPSLQSPLTVHEGLQLGSASLVIGAEIGPQGLRGDEELPAWVQAGQEPDPRLRTGEIPGGLRGSSSTAASNVFTSAGAALDHAASVKPVKTEKTLDDWLDEDDGDEEEEEEEEDSDDDDEESSEEESEDEESDDEETDEEPQKRLIP